MDVKYNVLSLLGLVIILLIIGLFIHNKFIIKEFFKYWLPMIPIIGFFFLLYQMIRDKYSFDICMLKGSFIIGLIFTGIQIISFWGIIYLTINT